MYRIHKTCISYYDDDLHCIILTEAAVNRSFCDAFSRNLYIDIGTLVATCSSNEMACKRELSRPTEMMEFERHKEKNENGKTRRSIRNRPFPSLRDSFFPSTDGHPRVRGI